MSAGCTIAGKRSGGSKIHGSYLVDDFLNSTAVSCYLLLAEEGALPTVVKHVETSFVPFPHHESTDDIQERGVFCHLQQQPQGSTNTHTHTHTHTHIHARAHTQVHGKV